MCNPKSSGSKVRPTAADAIAYAAKVIAWRGGFAAKPPRRALALGEGAAAPPHRFRPLSRSRRPGRVVIPTTAGANHQPNGARSMADSEPTTARPTPQMSPAEMHGLARRLHARADSVLLRDQPEQQSDMRTAARLVEHVAELHTAIRTAAAATNDAIARLVEHIGGL